MAMPAKAAQRHSVRDALGGRMRDALFGLSPDFPQVIELDLDRIRPNPHQPRQVIDEEALEELARSIEQHGLLQPVVVKEDGEGFVLVAGQRRVLAQRRLGRPTIFAVVTSGDADELALIENLQREDLDPLDEALALAGLMARHGYTQEQLGRVLGRRQSTISEALSLNALPEAIKAAYRTSDTRVAKAVLVELARIQDPAEQLALWVAVRDGGTLRQLRARKAAAKAAREAAGPPAALKVLASGHSFVRQLERLPAAELATDRDRFRELLALRARIDALMDGYLARHGAPDEPVDGDYRTSDTVP
jgi:ParB family transcriptional regulator, chromosome partitioning protein